MRIPGGLYAIRRTFALRDYRLYVIGNLASNTGHWLQRVAIGWLTWELTHSTAWLGAIALAEAAPSLALSLLAGAVVDRVNYFRMMKITQALTVLYTVMMAAFTLSGLMNVWLLLGLTVMRGSVGAFYRPARMTVVYNLVGRDLLASALAVNSIVFNSSRFIGPALGGAIIALAGVGAAFAAAAILFLVYSVMLRLMVLTYVPVERVRQSMAKEMAEGTRYILTHVGIRLQLVLLLGTAFLARPLTDLLPGFAGEVFKTGADGLALLLSAHGIGATAGALLLAGRGRGLAGMSGITVGSILLIGISLLLFVATQVFWVACLLAALVGFGFIVQNVTNQTLIQSATDPAFRGRVLSIYGMIAQGMPSLGALFIGGVAEYVGLRAPIAGGAALCILLWLWAWPQRQALMSLETAPVVAGDRTDPAKLPPP